MPPLRQLLTDLGVAVGLVVALSLVFLVEPSAPATPDGAVAEGGGDDRGNLLRPKARRGAVREGSIYAERTADPEERAKAVQRRGGSPISERAVQDGLDWLARHQAQDGHWSDQCLAGGTQTRCDKTRPCQGPGQHYPTAQTGLALLALQGGGHFYFNEAPYSTTVKRGLEWLVGQQAQDGCLTKNRGSYYMYEHAIATFALAEAVATARHSDESPDPRYVAALERAVRFIEQCQDPGGGGWRYAPRQAGDTSVSGWVVLALKTAKEAEVAVDPACVKRAIEFFKGCETGSNGRTGYVGGLVLSEATTGVGMLVHHFLLGKSDTPLVKAAAAYLAGFAENTWGKGAHVNYYVIYNCTLGMFLAGGPEWDRWNKAVRDQVVKLQVKAGCERGSWPVHDSHDITGGRVYSTALAVLTLEVYYRFARKDAPPPGAPEP